MSSPITINGFNNIDFGLIVDALIQQERAPIRNMELSRSGENARLGAYAELRSRLAAVESSAAALEDAQAFDTFTGTIGDTKVATVSTGTGSTAGTHDIVVNNLAQAQVLASTSQTATVDTVVADAGTLDIGGEVLTLASATTLAELRDQININGNVGATASLVDTGAGFKLVLTAKGTGTASAFTVTNNLTLAGGSSAVVFADNDTDGVSGDTAADNAQVAVDASLSVDNIAITRSVNEISNVVPGITINLHAVGSTSLAIEKDVSAIRGKIQSFADAYNGLSQYVQEQVNLGTSAALSGDFILRSASSEVRALVRGSAENGGVFKNLAEIGLVLDRTGELTVDETKLDAVLGSNLQDVQKLFQDSATVPGEGLAFRLGGRLEQFLGSNGLLAGVEDRIDASIDSLNDRIASLEQRLILREQELRQMFTAADQAISTLTNQGGSLASIVS